MTTISKTDMQAIVASADLVMHTKSFNGQCLMVAHEETFVDYPRRYTVRFYVQDADGHYASFRDPENGLGWTTLCETMSNQMREE